MKKLLVIITLSLIYVANVTAQIDFGIKAGLSSQDLSVKETLFNKNDESLKISLKDANYGYHAGLFARAKVLGIFVEPSILYNSARMDYTIEKGIFDIGTIKSVHSESSHKIDVPMLVGFKLSVLKLQAGPVAHVNVTNMSDLKENINAATFGYQAGLGLEVYKFGVELNYEGNLSKVTNDITIDGETYTLSETPSRLVASIIYKF